MEKTEDYLQGIVEGYSLRRIDEVCKRVLTLEQIFTTNGQTAELKEVFDRLTVIEKRLSDMLYHNGKHIAETPSKSTGLQCLFETLPEEVPEDTPLYSHRCRSKDCRHVVKDRSPVKQMKCPVCKVSWMTVRPLKYLTPKNLARYPEMMKQIYGTEVTA